MAFKNKYAPKTLDDLVIDAANLRVLKLMASQQLKDHLLLEGTNGTGKTSIIELLPTLTFGTNYQIEEVMGHKDFVINESVLNKWDNFISWGRFQDQASYILINEIDKITANLPLFWQWLDTNRECVTVIGTTNQVLAINKALRSRMKCLSLKPVTAINMLPRAQQIFASESLSIDEAYLLSELKAVEASGDIRKYLERMELVAIAIRSGEVNADGVLATTPQPSLKRVK